MGKSSERTAELYAAFNAEDVAWDPPPSDIPEADAIRRGTWVHEGVSYSIMAKDDVVQIFDHDEWEAFLDGVRRGEFNLPESASSPST